MESFILYQRTALTFNLTGDEKFAYKETGTGQIYIIGPVYGK